MIQKPLRDEILLVYPGKTRTPKPHLDFPIRQIIFLFFVHASFGVHVKIGPQKFVIKPNHFMDQDFRHRITHRDDNIAFRFQAAIRLGQLKITQRLRNMIYISDKCHRVKRFVGERKMRNILNQILLRQTFVGIYVNAFAADPEVLLMDEPCSALDPIAAGKIEDLIHSLKGEYSVLIVAHNMQQATRTSDYTAFMYLGRLIEYGPTIEIFERPRLKEAEDYITGRFG